MGTRTLHRDGAIALAGLLVIHVLLAWALLRAMRLIPSDGDEQALQVVFLPRRALAVAPEPPPRPRKEAWQRAIPAPDKESPPADAATVDAAQAPVPLQARLLEQSAAAAARVAPIEIPAHDALADRQARLPGRAGGRFRMHERLSPAQAVAMVGKLFGGMDPDEIRAQVCTRNRHNLVTAAGRGDSPELQAELEIQRRYCEP